MNFAFLGAARAAALGGLIAAVAAFGLHGCSAASSALGGKPRKEALAEVKWEFAKNAVSLEIQADEQLNAQEGEAHTLLLGVYQMADPAAFHKLAADAPGMAASLDKGAAGEGFIDLIRFVVVPGARAVVHVDRAQKSRYVGLIAGYYAMDGASSARLFEIPLTIDSAGLIAPQYSAAPAPLALRLKLGAQGFVNAERINRLPEEKPALETIPLDGAGRAVNLSAPEAQASVNSNSSVYRLKD